MKDSPSRDDGPGTANLGEKNIRIGERAMIAKERLAQEEKRALDLQLDEELKATFPASDPLKVTRRSTSRRGAAAPSPKNAPARKHDTRVRSSG